MNVYPSHEGWHASLLQRLGIGTTRRFSHGRPLSADAFEDQMFFRPRAAIAASRMTAADTALQGTAADAADPMSMADNVSRCREC